MGGPTDDTTRRRPARHRLPPDGDTRRRRPSHPATAGGRGDDLAGSRHRHPSPQSVDRRHALRRRPTGVTSIPVGRPDPASAASNGHGCDWPRQGNERAQHAIGTAEQPSRNRGGVCAVAGLWWSRRPEPGAVRKACGLTTPTLIETPRLEVTGRMSTVLRQRKRRRFPLRKWGGSGPRSGDGVVVCGGRSRHPPRVLRVRNRAGGVATSPGNTRPLYHRAAPQARPNSRGVPEASRHHIKGEAPSGLRRRQRKC